MPGDYYVCPYCSAFQWPAEVESSSGYTYNCCINGTLRAMIELEKTRPKSIFAKYFFGNDKAATLFRANLQGFNKLMALASKIVRPISTRDKWHQCWKNNMTVTIRKAEIAHLMTTNMLPDKKYQEENADKLGYMEDYILDEQSQLEKRIAIGDRSWLKPLSSEK